MEKIDLPFFYQLGATLHPLAEMQPENASRIDVLITMIDAQMLLGKLLDSFAALTVCRSGGRALLAAMDSSKSKLVKEKLD